MGFGGGNKIEVWVFPGDFVSQAKQIGSKKQWNEYLGI